MTKTLADIAEIMRDVDFTMLSTKSQDGGIAARPMSNNRDVEYDGDSWFFSMDDTLTVQDIGRDANVGMTLHGNKSIIGKPPIFIAAEGKAEIVRDKGVFAEHWVKDLERWFKDGIDTPGLVLIKVHADRVHYWDGEDQGEVKL